MMKGIIMHTALLAVVRLSTNGVTASPVQIVLSDVVQLERSER